MSARRAVFLDRDGVLNHGVSDGSRTRAPRTLDELVIVPGAAAAVGRLRDAGYVTVLVTNQPDVARGAMTSSTAAAIDDAVRAATGVDHSRACWHDNGDGCGCRKPRPGMLVAAAERLGLDLADSWMVGDRWVDIAAGAAVGTRTILIEMATSWERTSSGAPPSDLRPDHTEPDLEAAVARILAAGDHLRPTSTIRSAPEEQT